MPFVTPRQNSTKVAQLQIASSAIVRHILWLLYPISDTADKSKIGIKNFYLSQSREAYLAKNILLIATSFRPYSDLDRLSYREAQPLQNIVLLYFWVSMCQSYNHLRALRFSASRQRFSGAQLTPRCNLWLVVSFRYAKYTRKFQYYFLFLCSLFLFLLSTVQTIANKHKNVNESVQNSVVISTT